MSLAWPALATPARPWLLRQRASAPFTSASASKRNDTVVTDCPAACPASVLRQRTQPATTHRQLFDPCACAVAWPAPADTTALHPAPALHLVITVGHPAPTPPRACTQLVKPDMAAMPHDVAAADALACRYCCRVLWACLMALRGAGVGAGLLRMRWIFCPFCYRF